MEPKTNSGQTTELAEYSEITAGIESLKEKYEGRVYEVTTTAGMKDAKIARAEVRGQRTSLEKIRKAIKAPALAKCKLIDSEAKRINVVLLDIESPIDKLIKDEEARKAAEKAAREEAERQRIAGITRKIAGLKFTLSEHHPVSELKKVWDRLAETHIDEDYGEFTTQAVEALEAAKQECGRVMQAAFVRETDEAKAEEERKAQAEREAKERAERERMLKEQAVTQAKEQARIDAEKAKLEKLRAAQQAELDQKQAELDALKAKERQREEMEKQTQSQLEPEPETRGQGTGETATQHATTRAGNRLLALKRIVEICNTETWSPATKIKRITAVANDGVRGLAPLNPGERHEVRE